ncbi:MAG: Nif11-like leader peptide family natural product precursor [Cyanobacteriota bacterium]|jgi:3-deoxy-D-manno-octulosonic-acid transferase
MATDSSTHPEDAEMASDVLHHLKQLIQSDPAFAQALRHIETTEQAAELIHQHGLEITPETLWRHRGTLVEGGLPTWRG